MKVHRNPSSTSQPGSSSQYHCAVHPEPPPPKPKEEKKEEPDWWKILVGRWARVTVTDGRLLRGKFAYMIKDRPDTEKVCLIFVYVFVVY